MYFLFSLYERNKVCKRSGDSVKAVFLFEGILTFVVVVVGEKSKSKSDRECCCWFSGKGSVSFIFFFRYLV